MTGRSGGTGACARLQGWLQLTHPGPSLATTLLTFACARAAGGGRRRPGCDRARRAAAAMVLAQASTGCLNDWADAGRDAVAQPYKPIPRGRVGRTAAGWVGVGLGAAALAVARPLGRPAQRWLWLGLLAGWGYDLGLSGTVASPVPWVVGLAAVPMLGIRAAAGRTPVRRSLVPLVGVLATAAHLANGAPDAGTDLGRRRRGLPARLGTRASWRAARAGTLLAAAGVVASAPEGRRVRSLAWALPAALAVAGDRRRGGGGRRPGSMPFVRHACASVLVGLGWLSGGWRAGPP
ncbi:MAG TPA: UbiA family prenyltransferase [Candidatus Micrarchaeia archaeon]|nr:UbiA family prenyltransferase [Candidatus Micrarchaeia archaeon]